MKRECASSFYYLSSIFVLTFCLNLSWSLKKRQVEVLLAKEMHLTAAFSVSGKPCLRVSQPQNKS